MTCCNSSSRLCGLFRHLSKYTVPLLGHPVNPSISPAALHRTRSSQLMPNAHAQWADSRGARLLGTRSLWLGTWQRPKPSHRLLLQLIWKIRTISSPRASLRELGQAEPARKTVKIFLS